jgi:hypothetical protein
LREDGGAPEGNEFLIDVDIKGDEARPVGGAAM